MRAVGGFGSLWVTNCGAGYVSRINPDTNAVITTIPTGACPFGIATLDGAVWVADGDDHVSRIDPATNRVRNIHVRLASCPVEQCTDGLEVYRELAVGFGAVWITGHRGQVMRLDPRTDQVTAVRVAPGLARVVTVAVGFGSVWAASERSRQ